ncbi:MAG: DUF2997 domain-containing protein [Acidobacteriota bacterium]
MKTVILTVSPTGQASVETEGFEGESCLEATKKLKEALGEEVSTEMKPEAEMAYASLTQDAAQ